MAAYLSARQAAEVCGVSEKTIRNWIAVGKLSAERSAAGFRITGDQLEPLLPRSARTSATVERNGAESADGPQTLSADGSAAMLELVRLVAQLQGDVVAKAEAAAMWQTRAELLAIQLQQAQETIRALQAPREPTPAEIAPEHAADGLAVEMPQAPPRPERPWWRFW